MPVDKFVVANRVFAHRPIRFTAAHDAVTPVEDAEGACRFRPPFCRR